MQSLLEFMNRDRLKKYKNISYIDQYINSGKMIENYEIIKDIFLNGYGIMCNDDGEYQVSTEPYEPNSGATFKEIPIESTAFDDAMDAVRDEIRQRNCIIKHGLKGWQLFYVDKKYI